MKLTLSEICMDGGTQPRAILDDARIEQYAESYAAGEQLPPVSVCYDGAVYWLWDGFHRCVAADKAGLDSLDADVTQGSREDAVWLSLGANRIHDKVGLYRSNSDKRRAVEQALALRPSMSDRAIAEHVGVHHETVAAVRGPSTGENRQSRTGRDGKDRPATQPPRAPRVTREVEHIDNRTGEVLPSVTKRTMTMAEYNALPETETAPGVGLALADKAIAILTSIPASDSQRRAALDRVRTWLINQN